MKKALLTTALIAATAAFGATSATAQGIAPVINAPATDVTVGTLEGENTMLFVAGGAALVLLGLLHSGDGTN